MPDLNSVPPSPRVLALSRRASSQQMPPPAAPAQGQGQGQGAAPPTSDPSLNILPSNQAAVNTGAPTTASLPSPRLAGTGSTFPPADASSLASGPGPTRHPHPLTAAELHQQVEKEQEAVVCPCFSAAREFEPVPADTTSVITGQPSHARTRYPEAA